MGSYPEIFNPIWEHLIFPFKNNKLIDNGQSRENADVFFNIFEANNWGSNESFSGPGSELRYTKILRKKLPGLLCNLNIKSILDAPCGDGNWIKQINFRTSIDYFGGDIVPELVEINRQKRGFCSKFVKPTYRVIDIVNDDLPEVDLWLCRDVLFHLSNKDIFAALKNFKKSKIDYLLTTSFSFPKSNIDVLPGGFRAINLEIEPFNFPKPLLKISDFIVPFPPRYLALYHKSQL